VNPREEGLGCGDGAFEALNDLGQGLADSSLFFDAVVERGEDVGVEKGLGRHFGEGDDEKVMVWMRNWRC
jgi:hypothetical protein